MWVNKLNPKSKTKNGEITSPLQNFVTVDAYLQA